MSQGFLDFDVGNTRVKWRYSLAGAVISSGAVAHAQCRLEELPVESPGRIRVASVAGDDKLGKLLTVCRERWRVEPEIARVLEQCAGVRQGYTDKSHLGVDRWLALLAAHRIADQGCLVVSCGTAITVDLLTAAGEHRGGYIVPGLELMRSALFAGTSAVKLDRIAPPESLAPGQDTVPAVNRGILAMLAGLVDRARLELATGGDTPTIVVTGGDGELVLPFMAAPFTSTKAIYNPNLVLDGLALALP